METPKTDGSKVRQRHVPTPKMSDRKKSLFGKTKFQTLDENSDLGLILPLENSSDDSLEGSYSFRNVLNEKYRLQTPKLLSVMCAKNEKVSSDDGLNGSMFKRKLVIPLKDIHNDPEFHLIGKILVGKEPQIKIHNSPDCFIENENALSGFPDDTQNSKHLCVELHDIQNDLSDYSIDSNSIKRQLKVAKNKENLDEIQKVNEHTEIEDLSSVKAPQAMKTPGDDSQRTQQKNTIPKSNSFLKVFNNDFDGITECSESEEETCKRKHHSIMSASPEVDYFSPPAKKMLISKARTSLLFNELPEIPSSSFYGKGLDEDYVVVALNKSLSPVEAAANTSKSQKLPNHHIRNTNGTKARKSVSTRRIPGTINNGIHLRRIKKITRRVQTREEILKSIDLSKFTKLQIVDTALQACVPKTSAPSNDKIIWEKQLTRLREMWKTTKNPTTVIKPITLNTRVSTVESTSSQAQGQENMNPSISELADPEIDEQVPEKTRKFFKTGSTLNKNRFNLINNIFASVDHGKVHINPTKKKRRKLFKPSMFEEDCDDDASMVDPTEIGDILKTLDKSSASSSCQVSDSFEMQPETSVTKEAEGMEQSPTSQLRNLTIELSLGSPIMLPVFDQSAITNEQPSAASASVSTANQLFPIFYKDQQKSDAPQDVVAPTIFNNLQQNRKKKYRPIMSGGDQYQIDAGQKAFGGIECSECSLFYTQHEPEEELMHEQYHNSVQMLTFKGWQEERVVCDVLEWGVYGRIIAAHSLDGHQKWTRLKEILTMVDTDLGIYDPMPNNRSMIYLAIARSKIIGVCVAQPLKEAYKLLTIGDDNDSEQVFCSTEMYPVKCGISRIWVPAAYRNQGIGKKLLNAVQSHFIFGYYLSVEEIAFSSPTGLGRKFAEAITKRKDFHVYY